MDHHVRWIALPFWDCGATMRASSTSSSAASDSWTIGIDFGTHVCSAAMCKDGVVMDVPLDSQDARTLPAFVSVTDSGYLVGSEARKRARRGDTNTVFDFVRLVGRKVREISYQERRKWPFKVVPGDNDKALVEITMERDPVTRNMHPEELLAVLFLSMKDKAEAVFKTRVDTSVVCVPEGFNHTQRRAVRNACVVAGFRVEHVLCAATAAAIAFGTECKDTTPTQVCMTIDIGASSTKISLVSVVGSEFDVKAVASDLTLGGNDFTERIVAHCHRRKPAPAAVADDSTNKEVHWRGLNQIRQACELAKKLLSASTSAVVGIDFPAPGTFGHYSVTRSCFEALCEDYWQRLLEHASQLLHESCATRKDDIDTVVLLGGSAQIPRIQTMFKAFFPTQKVLCAPDNVSPARGAALCARTSSSAHQRAVASDIQLLEVTPLPLGIQSVGGTRIVMIPHNTRIPVHKSFLYYASCQNAVAFQVLEGTNFSKPANALHHLTSVRVDGSHATKHLVLKIDITFEIDSLDQIVVTAVERSSGRKATAVLYGDETGLSASAIAHANARLHNQIQDSTAMVLVPRNSVLQIPHLTGNSLLSTEDPIELLEEYVNALQIAIDADKLETTLSAEDKDLVSAIMSMLASIRTKRRVGTRPPPPPPPPASQQ